MAIKRGNIDLDAPEDESTEETDEERQAREDQAAADRREQEREDKLRQAELDKARLEGENDALKRGVKSDSPTPQAALTDAQWAELEQAHGKTRQQIMADAQLTRATAEEAIKPLRDLLAKAQEDAAEARAEAKRAKTGTTLYAVEKDFFDKNPGLAGHRGDIDTFLAKFPEDMRSDPAKLKDLLADAKTYVRGKVREERLSSRGRDGERRGSTDRPEFSDDPEVDDGESKLDLGDLDNEGSRRLVESIARRPGGEDLADAPPAIDEVSVEKAYKLSERTDGRGVSIDERGEFARGRRRSETALRDPRQVVRTNDDERDRRRR